MKRDASLRAKLFTQSGFPCAGLRHVLFYCDAKDLATLETLVDSGELHAREVFRIRGNGSHYSPGILAQYLFNLPSGATIRAERVDSQWGYGADI